MNVIEVLRGKRCVGQIRCSRKVQAKKSLPQQRKWLRDYSEAALMCYVDDMKEAVSASQVKRRPDLDRIFERKRMLNDFEVVLVQDLSRLTRGGVEHGLSLYFRFKEAGLILVSLVDGVIAGDEMIVKAAQRFQEARATAKATAMVSRRGVLAARDAGRVTHTMNIPFGIDRLIRNSKGEALFILRNLHDGTQKKLSPDGQVEMFHFKPNAEGERTRHIKQHDEFEECVPGAQADIDITNFIYQSFFVDRLTPWWIARLLNDKRAVGPKGRGWFRNSVAYILRNPVYLGVGYADRTSTALFWMNGTSNPIEVQKSDAPLDKFRAQEHWYRRQYAALDNFLALDDAWKVKIAQWQHDENIRLADHTPRKRGGDRHQSSSFFLKKILRSKQGNHPLSGSSMKTKAGKVWRYYRVSKATSVPTSGGVINRLVNAGAIESSVKQAVGDLIRGYPGLRAAVIAACQSHANAANVNRTNGDGLRAERDRLIAEMSYWVKQLSILGQSVIDSKVEPLRHAIRTIGDQLGRAEASDFSSPAIVAQEIDESLKYAASMWDTLSPPALNRVLQLIVGKLEIDMENFSVELDLRIPSWAAGDALQRACLENDTSRCVVFDTYTLWTVPLGSFVFEKTARAPQCFSYRRKANGLLDAA